MFPEILEELLLVGDIFINIHVETADEIEVNMLFHYSLPSTILFQGFYIDLILLIMPGFAI